jgi:protein-L-isoaspartate(D-aspartate) O-methyltransferase
MVEGHIYIVFLLHLERMFEQERERLVAALFKEGYIKTDAVKQAFLTIRRELFIPHLLQSYAYIDTPLDIGQGQTISAPHMIALMCEALDVHEGQKILEIGTGSGYHAAIVAQLIGKTGQVYSIERFPALAKSAREHLTDAGVTNVTVEIGDGSCGLPRYQPYDRIYVTAAAPYAPPPLLEELKDPGTLLVPVGDMYCELTLFEKKGKTITSKNLGGCVFVPLIGRYGH